MHETALRLFPDSPYAKEHGTEAPKKPAKILRGREDGASHHAQTP
jgi:hypothetical protein